MSEGRARDGSDARILTRNLARRRPFRLGLKRACVRILVEEGALRRGAAEGARALVVGVTLCVPVEAQARAVDAETLLDELPVDAAPAHPLAELGRVEAPA